MDWCRLSTSYYLDAALLRAGEAAELLYLRCLAYSGARESRGRVPRHALPMLAPTKTQARLRALVEQGLLIEDGQDVLIRSWERWQEALDTEAERREKDRVRKAAERAAKRGQSTPASSDVSSDSPRTVRPKSARKEVEVEEEKTLKTSVASLPDGFEDFWTAYPRRIGRGSAVKAWKTATKKEAAEVIVPAAASFAHSVSGTDPKFIPHPASWLNAERWADERPKLRAVSGGQPAWKMGDWDV